MIFKSNLIENKKKGGYMSRNECYFELCVGSFLKKKKEEVDKVEENSQKWKEMREALSETGFKISETDSSVFGIPVGVAIWNPTKFKISTSAKEAFSRVANSLGIPFELKNRI